MTALLNRFPTAILLTASFLTGCAAPTLVIPPPIEGALFCDIEEPRRFSQAEIDWRAEYAPWNLRRDFQTNTAWDRECVDPAT